MKGDSTATSLRTHSEFSLTIAARALAASTVCYLEPHTRGLSFCAYDAIMKDTLLPPFSEVISVDECGRDISSASSNNEEECVDEQAVDDKAIDEKGQSKKHNALEFQKRFNGDYELYEKYDRAGKQKVRCLIAVVHGKVRERETCKEDNTEHLPVFEYIPGSISITFRGTDTLENVVADVKAITVPYDDPPFVPSDTGDSNQKSVTSEKEAERVGMGTWRSTVHYGFKDAWYGDDLRQTILQYTFDKLKELDEEIQEANRLGLLIAPSSESTVAPLVVPTIDIVGHSLGGSIAVLAAYDLAKSIYSMKSSKQAHIRVYTMGCPRVGNVRFAKLFNKLVPDCWNVINDNDIVPAIPHSPTAIRSRLPFFCPCRDTGYKRHGRAVILKENGELIINPSKGAKYRREAKVLRLKSAIDSHMTKYYRNHIRAAIRNEIKLEETRIKKYGGPATGGDQKHKHNSDWVTLDDLLERLGKVIIAAASDPNKSFHLLPSGT